MDWSKTAFVFPGQGSQIVGMGADIAAAYPVAREVFAQADAILGFALSEMCFHGTPAALDETINTQPALYVSSIAMLRALQTECPEAMPVFAAGHSLGEFTALTAAGALAFEDGVRLVRERARLMRDAGTENPGAMAALLGLDAPQVREICAQVSAETGGIVVLANDNCPGQVVISGDVMTLETAMERAKAAGAKRAVKLAVSVAAHSPLMQSAAESLSRQISATTFHAPQIPVYANVTAEPLRDVAAIRAELNAQLTEAVRWTESVQAMIGAGVETFVEIGAKDVLTGLLKRIDRAKTGIAVNNAESLKAFLLTIA